MDNFINIGRLTFITLLVVYEIYAFRKSKSLKTKLCPMILLVGIGVICFVLVPFLGILGSIFAILALELALMSSILVVLGEIGINLLSSRRNIPKILQLVGAVLILATIYYWAERVF